MSTTVDAPARAAPWRDFKVRTAPPTQRNVGLIVLSMDDTCADDLADFVAGTDISLITTRIVAGGDFPDPFCDMGDEVAHAVTQLMPGERLDAVVFACTACSLALGDEAIRAWVHRSRPGVPVINPMGALLDELRRRDSRRVGLMTPYSERANVLFEPFLNSAGIAVSGGLALKPEPGAGTIQPTLDSYVAAIEHLLDEGDPDTIVVSCASLKLAKHLPDLSRRFSVPILSSNQAVTASLLRLAAGA